MLDDEKEHEFKAWLEQGGSESENARNTRVSAIRTIERNLDALDMPYQDLDEAWETDKFETLQERLRKMRDDARAGGQDYRILMPDSENPHNKLSDYGRYLGQYGRFLAGDPTRADRMQKASKLKKRHPIFNGCAPIGNLLKTLTPATPEDSLVTVWFEGGFRGDSKKGKPTINVDKKIGDLERWFYVTDVEKVGGWQQFADGILVTLTRDMLRGREIENLVTKYKPMNLPNARRLAAPEPEASDQDADADKAADPSEHPEKPMSISPKNLILYGPPGTGKTYATAAEAVQLCCGKSGPEDRAELMAVYKKLVAAGRIEFVTFHQSMSYEDFVEGRQPMTGADGDGEAESMTGADGDGKTESVGFRLETVPGIFRRIAKRAETSRGPSSGDDAITLGDRQVFKMSIGRVASDEDAQLFEEAIKGGYTLLNYENIDWSNEQYADASRILEICQNEGRIPGPVNRRSGQVQCTNDFRNRMKVRDIIIVSKGNRFFRAIGEVTGEYEYHPRSEEVFPHRRAVRWLWNDDKGVSVNEINQNEFTQRTIYQLSKNRLKIAALERYMNSGRPDESATPESFVLIIDEINRANISRVFGELITLLEADKRLNQPNEVRVQLPYSEDEFGVPSNLHILGTMNTADRSIALLDTALRRRFTFREMMPDASILKKVDGIDLPKLLSTINERIEYLYDREHQIGHAYFTGCNSRADVDEVMRHKVIPLLAEYFFEDWSRIAAVLGDLEPNKDEIKGGFLKRTTLKAPPGIEDGDAAHRYRWEVRSEAEGFDYKKLTGT